LFLSLFLIISASTGVLLGWKKNSDFLQPTTQKGISKDMREWLSADKIATLASDHLQTEKSISAEVDRLDFRPSKGIVKVLFDKGYWEVQVDAKTGEIKSAARRHSDWIEAIHDGSIISQLFKFISMNLLGIGLLLLIIAGLYLYFGPKKIRKLKRDNVS